MRRYTVVRRAQSPSNFSAAEKPTDTSCGRFIKRDSVRDYREIRAHLGDASRRAFRRRKNIVTEGRSPLKVRR